MTSNACDIILFISCRTLVEESNKEAPPEGSATICGLLTLNWEMYSADLELVC